jgi:hypothetical protein
VWRGLPLLLSVLTASLSLSAHCLSLLSVLTASLSQCSLPLSLIRRCPTTPRGGVAAKAAALEAASRSSTLWMSNKWSVSCPRLPACRLHEHRAHGRRCVSPSQDAQAAGAGGVQHHARRCGDRGHGTAGHATDAGLDEGANGALHALVSRTAPERREELRRHGADRTVQMCSAHTA